MIQETINKKIERFQPELKDPFELVLIKEMITSLENLLEI